MKNRLQEYKKELLELTIKNIIEDIKDINETELVLHKIKINLGVCNNYLEAEGFEKTAQEELEHFIKNILYEKLIKDITVLHYKV